MILGYRDVFLKMDEIIQKPIDSEVTIDEWLDALDKLKALRDEIRFNVFERREGIKNGIEEYGQHAYDAFDKEAQRMSVCAEAVRKYSVKIIHIASKDNFEYKDVSEYIRRGWNQLDDFYSYSRDRLSINSYSICYFDSFAALLEDAIRMVADRLKGQENYYDRMR